MPSGEYVALDGGRVNSADRTREFRRCWRVKGRQGHTPLGGWRRGLPASFLSVVQDELVT